MADEEGSQQAESSSDDEQEKNEEPTEQERADIRQQLSTMSFEDLLKLKDEMGAKVYNETVYGFRKNNSNQTFKRANKNRPREMSSKRPVKTNLRKLSVKKQSEVRDPRFDPLCGEFDRKNFKKNYTFVHELRQKEKSQLEKELKQTTDEEEIKKMKFVIQRLDNQIREEEKRSKVEKAEREEMSDMKNKMKRGEKVDFKKKSVKRLEDLIAKYEELKKTNKLQKHIERRTKKLRAKDLKKNLIR